MSAKNPRLWRFTWEAQSHVPFIRLFISCSYTKPSIQCQNLEVHLNLSQSLVLVSWFEDVEFSLRVRIPRVSIDPESPVSFQALDDLIEVKLSLLLPVDHPIVSSFYSVSNSCEGQENTSFDATKPLELGPVLILIHVASSSPWNSVSVVDPSNPYYIHHEDSPGSSLVSQVFDGENYYTWSHLIVMALKAKNKIGFIDGTLSKPSSASDPLSQAWTRCNAMVFSWILNSISKEIAASVIFMNSAEEIWTDLKERYSQSNGLRIFQLKKAIASLSQEQASVSTYFTRLKGLWHELHYHRPIPTCTCSCEALKTVLEYQQEEYIFHFLMGLNESFSCIRGQILLDPLPSINKVLSLVLQEERLREIATVGSLNLDPASAALVTKSVPTSQSQSGKLKLIQKERPACDHCGFVGHTIEKCYNLHGFPPGYKFTKRQS